MQLGDVVVIDSVVKKMCAVGRCCIMCVFFLRQKMFAIHDVVKTGCVVYVMKSV